MAFRPKAKYLAEGKSLPREVPLGEPPNEPRLTSPPKRIVQVCALPVIALTDEAHAGPRAEVVTLRPA